MIISRLETLDNTPSQINSLLKILPLVPILSFGNGSSTSTSKYLASNFSEVHSTKSKTDITESTILLENLDYRLYALFQYN